MAATGRIACIDLAGQLAVVSPTGDGLVRLTEGETQFQFPAWSPDNRWLALIGDSAQGVGVFLSAVDESGPGPVQPHYTSSSQPPIYLSWSPDGALISLLALHPDFGLALYLLNLAETGRSLAPVLGGQPCFWHWHLDSRGVLVHVNLGDRAAQLTHVRWRDPAQPSIQPIDIQPGYFQAPAISPDGRQLAYAQLSHTGESQLVVASRERKHVISAHSGLAALNWSPQADRLAFIHPLANANSYAGPLHLWQSDDEQVRQLSSEDVVAFFWAPNGERIAYLTVVADPARVATEQASGGANGHVKGSWPFLQIGEQATIRLAVHILDIQTGRDHQVTILTPSQPFLRQFLPFFDQYAKSHAIWSPESEALVLPAEVNGRSVILVIDLSAEEVRAITPGVMATWSW